jgi:hypothetical protein
VCVSRQVLSSKSTAAALSFRMGRAEVDKPLAKLASSTPGPSFLPPDSLGPQTLSNRRTEATVAFSKAPRSPSPKSGAAPGPGQYSTFESIGKQTLSTKKTATSPSFRAR